MPPPTLHLTILGQKSFVDNCLTAWVANNNIYDHEHGGCGLPLSPFKAASAREHQSTSLHWQAACICIYICMRAQDAYASCVSCICMQLWTIASMLKETRRAQMIKSDVHEPRCMHHTITPGCTGHAPHMHAPGCFKADLATFWEGS